MKHVCRGLAHSLMTTSAQRLIIDITTVTWMRLALPAAIRLVNELALGLILFQCSYAIQPVTNRALSEALLCSKEQSISRSDRHRLAENRAAQQPMSLPVQAAQSQILVSCLGIMILTKLRPQEDALPDVS